LKSIKRDSRREDSILPKLKRILKIFIPWYLRVKLRMILNLTYEKLKRLNEQNPYSGFDDLRKNILRDFQCKMDLDSAQISGLLKTARRKNSDFLETSRKE